MRWKYQLHEKTKTLTVLLYHGISPWQTPADELQQLLMQAEVDGYQKLVVRINSPGGHVFTGYALYNAIRSSSLESTALVDGIAASMASYLLEAFSHIEMAKNAKIMLHRVRGHVHGTGSDMRLVV